MTDAGTQEKIEAGEVRRQLDRLLGDPHFIHSRRFPDFLRFVVQHTLAGRTEMLKERTLGIEVFGKEADYDTSADPIVRVTAAEIRKRIAQYYQEPGRESELRITLPSGTYVPRFEWPDPALATRAAHESRRHTRCRTRRNPGSRAAFQWRGARRRIAGAGKTARTHTLRFRAVLAALILVSLALASIGIYFAMQAMRQSAFNFFWKPVLGTSDPGAGLHRRPASVFGDCAARRPPDPSRQVMLKDTLTATIFDDLNAAVKVAGILQSAGKRYSLKSEGDTNLEDLRAGPTIFIGAFDNAWTLRLTNQLRYHFANSPDMTEFRIVDGSASNQNGQNQNRWMVDRKVQMATNNYRDYALVARFTDVNTGKPAVVAAGIGRGGNDCSRRIPDQTATISTSFAAPPAMPATRAIWK